MELTETALTVLKRRYLLRNEQGEVVETSEEMFRRVARAVAQAEAQCGEDSKKWEKIFYQMMVDLEFLPNSPCLFGAGTEHPMLVACFLLPVDDSMESIFDAVKHAALVHRYGGKR